MVRLSDTLTDGLSPRVRGNRRRSRWRGAFARSIPACAGEPARLKQVVRPPRVYPRVCGGTKRSSVSNGRLQGLSPRVRGNREWGSFRRCVSGSIPACAGEPTPASSGHSSSTVYPRVCGGTLCLGVRRGDQGGLSPRVRGNLRGRDEAATGERSIPACAGEPRTWPSQTCLSTVYPRVCGGTQGPRMVASKDEGLSPRVRGNHSGRAWLEVGPGSIPACAGEPTETQYPEQEA